MGSIDVLDVASDPVLDEAKTRALWFSGIGMGGPALVAGSLLLMYEVAMALFIGLGPIFILMLLFDATKQMFWKGLWLGIGTIFSMSILAVMVTISLDVVWRVATKMWGDAVLGSLLGVRFNDGMSSVAMQQGGLGMILSVLIMGTPPIAAMFFQGTVANFGGYNAMAQFASGGAGAAAMRPDGRGGMVPMSGGVVNQMPGTSRTTNISSGQSDTTVSNGARPDMFASNRPPGNSAPAQPEHAIPQKTGKYTPPPSS